MRLHKTDGIYEEVVSDSLNKQLASIDENLKYTEKIDPEEAPAILAEYTSKIIKQRLQMLQETKGELSEQIKLVNKLIEVVADDAADIMDEKVADQGRTAESTFAG